MVIKTSREVGDKQDSEMLSSAKLAFFPRSQLLTIIYFLALFTSQVSSADEPSQLGEILLESLTNPQSHIDPEGAFYELHDRAFQLMGYDEKSVNFSSFSYPESLSSVPSYMDGVAMRSSYMKHDDAVKVFGSPLDHCENAQIKWSTDRAHYNLLVEEFTHRWQHLAGPEAVLVHTPKYAEYLRQTGTPFDEEAHVYALLEQYGRRMSNFEARRYKTRIDYQNWLKRNCGVNKVYSGTRPSLHQPSAGSGALKTKTLSGAVAFAIIGGLGASTSQAAGIDPQIAADIASIPLTPEDIPLAAPSLIWNVYSENHHLPGSKGYAVDQHMKAYEYVMSNGIAASSISAPGRGDFDGPSQATLRLWEKQMGITYDPWGNRHDKYEHLSRRASMPFSPVSTAPCRASMLGGR